MKDCFVWRNHCSSDMFCVTPRGCCSLFSAVIGSGTQLLVLVFFIFGLSLVGVFYPYNRGAINTACLVIYALTAGVSGYVSAHLYRQMGGEAWVRIIPFLLHPQYHHSFSRGTLQMQGIIISLFFRGFNRFFETRSKSCGCATLVILQ